MITPKEKAAWILSIQTFTLWSCFICTSILEPWRYQCSTIAKACHNRSLFTGSIFVLLFNTSMVDTLQWMTNQLQQSLDVMKTEIKYFPHKRNTIHLTLSSTRKISRKWILRFSGSLECIIYVLCIGKQSHQVMIVPRYGIASNLRRVYAPCRNSLSNCALVI